MNIGVSYLVALPDRMRIVQTLPMGEITMVLNGDAGTMQGPQGSQPMPERVRQEVRSQMWRDLAYLFARWDVEGLEVSGAGNEDVDGRSLPAVRIQPPGAKPFTLLLDPDTHRPLRINFKGTTMQGAPVDSTAVIREYKAVGGVELPHHSVVYQEGEQRAETTVNEMTLNPDIEEDAFSVEKQESE